MTVSLRRTRWTALTAAVVATALATMASAPAVASSSAPAPSPAYEGPGSASAEDAAAAYMNALAGADVEAMVGAFAIETFVDRFDLRAYLERIGVFSAAAAPVLIPPETPFTRALAVEERRGSVFGQIRFQYLAFADLDIDLGQGVNLTADTTVDDSTTASWRRPPVSTLLVPGRSPSSP